MLKLRFRLFGSFEMAAAEQRCPLPLEGRKAQELISFLLLAPGQARSREATAEALWSDISPDRGRKQIRQALWHVHQIADSDTPEGQRLIVAASEHLAINRQRTDGCDALEFAKAVDSLETNPPTSTARLDLERALALYRGPLLEDCYSEWCLIERERLEDLYLGAVDRASARAEALHDYPAAAKWARALLGRDGAHERSHRRLMRVYSAMNDRSRALRQFERCCLALDRELGVRPADQTIALATAIRNDTGTPTDAPVPPTTAAAQPDQVDVVRELNALRRSIDELCNVVSDRLA